MSRVFITGASGFIGSHTVRGLLARGAHVTALVRPTADPSNLRGLPPERFTRVPGDLLRPETILPALEGCDEVYHLAGLVHTNPAYAARIYESNVIATINLFEACLRTQPGKIVYLASIFALGKGTKDRPADESTPYNLEGMAERIPYFAAKRTAETASYRYLDRGLPLVHIYPCYCLGPGDIYLSSSRLLAAYLNGFLAAYIRGGINVMDVRDTAEGLILGMEKGRVGEKYIIGNQNVSLDDLLDTLDRLTGRRRRRAAVPPWAGAAAGRALEVLLGRRAPLDRASALIMGEYWYYDSSKARRDLGFRGRPLEETLGDALDWIRSGPLRPAR